MSTYYIYKITNLFDNKIYIGQRKADFLKDFNYLGSGKIIHNAIKKYGKENFKKSLIVECQTKEEVNKLEIFWIQELQACDKSIGYNLAKGGEGGDTLSNHPDKNNISEKISKAGKGRKASKASRDKAKATFKETIEKRKKTNFVSKARGVKKSNKAKESMVLAWKTRSRKRKFESIQKQKNSIRQKYENGYIYPHKGKKIEEILGIDRAEEVKKICLKGTLGKHFYNNGERNIRVFEEDFINNYKSLGFKEGKINFKKYSLKQEVA